MGVNGLAWPYSPREGATQMVSYSSISTEGRGISSNGVFLCHVCFGRSLELKCRLGVSV